MTKYIHITIIAIFVLFQNLNAQKVLVKKADKQYDAYAFIDAIETYEKAAEKGYKDGKMLYRIANSYFFNSEYVKANKWYAEYFSVENTPDIDSYYRYALTLKSIGDYENSDKMMEQFASLKGDDFRAILYRNEKDYLDKIKENSGRYIIEKLNVNSEMSDFGAAFYADYFIFASSREDKTKRQKIQKWNNQAFLSLYSSYIDSRGNFQEPTLFFKDIDSDYNESTPTFTNDLTTIFFTRNNIKKNKKIKDKENTTLLKIFKGTFVKGTSDVIDIKELPFNSNEYSCAHPILSKDDKYLYFASDMPGSFGQSDIYRVKILGNDLYSEPENLGNLINTEGKETFPFISNDNELYFSSDGHPGLGGLDVFVTKLEKDKVVNKVKNLGEPINSRFDDFSFYIDTESKIGFLSSNRDESSQFDDIYKFKEIETIDCKQEIKGIVTDEEDGTPLANVKIALYNKDNILVKEFYTDENGAYHIKDLECDNYYMLRYQKREYETVEKTVITPKTSSVIPLDVSMNRIAKKMVVGDDLAKLFRISNIYFDLDKSNITKVAEIDLYKIVTVMKENPNMRIAINSHTDSRASHKYNEALSDRRAQSTRNWIISQGISSDRITAKGYGETRLVNKCADNVPCTEDEHQLNRRSEFIILDL